jgi:hypothetical protein
VDNAWQGEAAEVMARLRPSLVTTGLPDRLLDLLAG